MTKIRESIFQICGPLRRAHRASSRLILLTAVSVGLGGCFFDTAQWSAIESPKTNTVEWIRFDHRVKFDEVGARLTREERQRLSRFLGNIQANNRDDIVIRASGKRGAVRDEALAARRLSAVKAIVKEIGLVSQDPVPGRSNKDWDGTIDVVVGRYIVIGPKCPDWTKQGGSDWTNEPSSNLGCATTANLGMMLADPGDLVRTRPITPSDGQAGAMKVDQYRQGTTAEATASASGGS